MNGKLFDYVRSVVGFRVVPEPLVLIRWLRWRPLNKNPLAPWLTLVAHDVLIELEWIMVRHRAETEPCRVTRVTLLYPAYDFLQRIPFPLHGGIVPRLELGSELELRQHIPECFSGGILSVQEVFQTRDLGSAKRQRWQHSHAQGKEQENKNFFH